MPAALPRFQHPDSLVTAVVQDAATGEVLMLAHMNQAAWEETLATGRGVYFSRSRGRLWRKGEESGHVQQVKAIFVDCDGDAVLLKVDQVGGACHEGYRSCFFRQYVDGQWQTTGVQVFEPTSAYTEKS